MEVSETCDMVYHIRYSSKHNRGSRREEREKVEEAILKEVITKNFLKG